MAPAVDFMSSEIANLQEAIRQAAGQYFRLVLLVAPSGSGKTALLHAVAQENSFPLLNINLELSKRLLELTRSQRARQVERLFREVIASAPGGVVLLDNLEILFDPSLEVEPLRLLQIASRNRTLVVTWNGHYREGTLTYAEPGHPEYARFKPIEAILVTMDRSEPV
jgi:ATPase family protein associated with various cellular activities (AAA)